MKGGWKPQIFGNSYFYANGESLVWHYIDDIEFSMDVEKRLVQYRSSTRLGQIDWDVEKNRYNQFVRMLSANGGWDIAPLQKDLYIYKTPYRWVDLLLTKSTIAVEKTADSIVEATMSFFNDGMSNDIDNDNDRNSGGAAREQLKRLVVTIEELLSPLKESTDELVDTLSQEPGFRDLVRIQKEIQSTIDGTLPVYKHQVEEYTSKLESLFSRDRSLTEKDNTMKFNIDDNLFDVTGVDQEAVPSDSSGLSSEDTFNTPSVIRLKNPFGEDMKLPEFNINIPKIDFNADTDMKASIIERKTKTVINAKDFRKLKDIDDGSKPWLSSDDGGSSSSSSSRNRNEKENSIHNEVEFVMGHLDEHINSREATLETGVSNSMTRRERLVPARELRLGKSQLGRDVNIVNNNADRDTNDDMDQWGDWSYKNVRG